MSDTSTDAVDAVEQSTKRQHFTDVRYVTVRWEPYKPDGARQMKAKGRWQEQVGSGDYFRWQNCDRPEFAHDPETIEDLTAQLAAANTRADHARDAALVHQHHRRGGGAGRLWGGHPARFGPRDERLGQAASGPSR